MLNGIDVSSHQGTILWQKVKNAGVQFVMIRAGYGNSIAQKDRFFDANAGGALAAGIPFGAYWFSYALSEGDAKLEASVFLEAIAPYRGKMAFPAVFDYEYASRDYAAQHGVDATPQLINSMAAAFLGSVKAAGWEAMLYTNNDYRKNIFSAATLKAWPLWLADYSGAPDTECAIQQTGYSNQLDGISTIVGTDTAYRDYALLPYSCDTSGTVEVARGKAYQAEITCGSMPSVAAGTPDIVTVLPRFNSGNQYYFYFVPIGQPGQSAGIYINGGPRQFIVRVK